MSGALNSSSFSCRMVLRGGDRVWEGSSTMSPFPGLANTVWGLRFFPVDAFASPGDFQLMALWEGGEIWVREPNLGPVGQKWKTERS